MNLIDIIQTAGALAILGAATVAMLVLWAAYHVLRKLVRWLRT